MDTSIFTVELLCHDRFATLQALPFGAGLREANSGIGAIFATTRCRVVACSIEQRQLPHILPPADDTRQFPGNRHRSLPYQAAAASLPVKSTGAIILSCKKYPDP
jgi:hypothetical protein